MSVEFWVLCGGRSESRSDDEADGGGNGIEVDVCSWYSASYFEQNGRYFTKLYLVLMCAHKIFSARDHLDDVTNLVLRLLPKS